MIGQKKVNKKSIQKLKTALIIVGAIIGIELLIQCFWPSTILTPNTIIDDENFGLWEKTKAVSMLDVVYKKMPVEVFFGDNTDSYVDSYMEDVGMSVSNLRRVSQIDYPAQWRLVPTSLFWYGFLSQSNSPQTTVDEVALDNYINQNFGTKNHIEPVDAGLTITEQSIDLKKSQIGGDFSLSELKEAFKKPIYLNRKAIISVDITPEYPQITDEQALKVATIVSGQLINNVNLTFDDYAEEVVLPAETLRSWITFEIVDGNLTPVINEKKLNKFLASEVAPLIEKAAGTTIITTNDLAGLERKEGDEGKVLNTVETGLRIAEYLLSKRQSIIVAVESVDPTVEYVYERINVIEEEAEIKDTDIDDLLDTESVI